MCIRDSFSTAGQASGTFTDLVAGTYIVTVRDPGDISCESNCTITLTEPAVAPPKCIREQGEFTIIKRIP